MYCISLRSFWGSPLTYAAQVVLQGHLSYLSRLFRFAVTDDINIAIAHCRILREMDYKDKPCNDEEGIDMSLRNLRLLRLAVFLWLSPTRTGKLR